MRIVKVSLKDRLLEERLKSCSVSPAYLKIIIITLTILMISVMAAVPVYSADATDDRKVDQGHSAKISPVNLSSIEFSVSPGFPLGRYRDYTFLTVTTGAGAFMGFHAIPLEIGISGGFGYEAELNPYTDVMFHVQSLLTLGWIFTPPGSRITLTPRISGGFLGHFVWGVFNTVENVSSFLFFADQFYGVALDVGTPLENKKSPGQYQWYFYLAPGFYLYPNQTAVGMVIRLDAGFRWGLRNSQILIQNKKPADKSGGKQ
jgi:hypothetical protein